MKFNSRRLLEAGLFAFLFCAACFCCYEAGSRARPDDVVVTPAAPALVPAEPIEAPRPVIAADPFEPARVEVAEKLVVPEKAKSAVQLKPAVPSNPQVQAAAQVRPLPKVQPATKVQPVPQPQQPACQYECHPRRRRHRLRFWSE